MKGFQEAVPENTSSDTVSISHFRTKDILAIFLEKSHKLGMPLAAWRLPDQDTKHMILDLSGQSKDVDPDLESLPPGFIYSDFASDYSDSAMRAGYIHADLYFDSSSGSIKINDSKAETLFSAREVVNSMMERLEEGFSYRAMEFGAERYSDGSGTMSKEDFIRLVRTAQKSIVSGEIKKVVPSRCEYFSLPDNFNVVETFLSLCERYPQAFVSITVLPGKGIWMGASPEILVKTFCKQGQNFFSTIALAGTQKLEQAEAIKNAAWRIKEIEEQAMVSRYIINCFKKIRLREFDEDGPKTVSAGNLLHLRTDFTVNMNQVNFPELGSVMLRLLHPTSAVCGQPKESSVAFLKKYEGYDRGLYAGFLGPVNMRDEVNIFVNLRCMQLFRKQALLYAGAGVTADSDPEKEWQETAMKMQTLQQLL